MKKALKWILIIFGVLFLILLIAPFIFKDKIIAKIKTEANNNLNAKLDFGDFDLSLIRSFPNLSVNIQDLSIINLAPFNGDTLVYAKDFGLTIDIMSVIRGSEIKIKKINIDGPVMHFLVNKDGKVNWDIAKAGPDSKEPSQPSSFKASLNKYSIKDGFIVYDDQTMPFILRLEGVNHTGTGDFTQDLFTLNTKTEIKKADLAYGGVYYISKATADIDAALDMDMKNMKFTFKENKILLNELQLGLDGWLAMPDTNIDMSLTFNAAKSDFRNFISIVPAMFSESFKDIKTSGKMAFDGFVKGRYNGASMPGFGANLKIDNGMFKYPSLPSSVNNIFVDLAVNNPDGNPDHTFINLSKFHIEMNNDPFDAKLVLKSPVSDPDINAFMKGKIDLSGIQKFMPLEKGTSLSGIITADITAIGRMSSIEQKKFEQFNASGNFAMTGMKYTSTTMKQPVVINTLQMTFNPQRVALTAFDSKIGKSDFKANGSLDNFLAYAIKNEVLRGTLRLNSTTIDLNEFMGGEATSGEAGKDTTKLAVLDIPANIDFTFSAAIANLIYQNLTINNVAGKIIVKDKAIRMQDVGMKLLDGSLSLRGGYSSADLMKPSFDFSLDAKEFDIQKTTQAFITVQKLAPIAKNCSGKFSTNMTIKGDLDQKMEPVMQSLTGAGKLSTSKVMVSNFPAFNKIADVLKMESWRKLEIPPVNPSFKFSGGRVFVDPFDMSVNGIKASVAGSNGFDQTLDYTMATQIPRASFGGAANSVLDNLVASANKNGANVSIGDVIPVNIKIGGTVSDPKIGTDLNKAGAKAMDDLKAKAKEEFEKQKAEAEAKAKAEADKLKKEGEAKLNAEKQKAQAEGERLKREAEAKAKAQADSAKKAAEKKAKDKLKDLFKK
jgi:hypothetical protein